MDPSAPDNNDKNSQQDSNQPTSPIQPGQFVVSGEAAAPSPPDLSISPPPDIAPQTPVDNTQPPQTFDSSLPPSPQEPVANSSIGPQLASDYSGQVPDMSATSPQFAASQPSSPQPPTNMQPDPTPFTPPAAPDGPQVPGLADSSSGDSSKMAKLKIVAIVAAILGLVAIIVAVIWFFVLSKKPTEQVNVTNQTNQIEESTLPSPQTGSRFGDLPQATQEATKPAGGQPVTP